LPVVAGSRRTCVNSAFAQPGRYSRQHEDHSYGDDQFPFSYRTLSDPISGRTGAIVHSAGPLSKKDLNNFAPRIGLAWNFHPKFVFRSSFGLVHQDIFATGTNIMYQEYLATATLQAPVGDPQHVFRLAQGPQSFQYSRQPDGSVPFVIPDVIGNPGPAAAAWADAAAIVPWVIYQRTGDSAILRRQLPSMAAWVDKIVSLAGDDRLWTGGFQFGDWLDPDAPPDAPAAAKADPDVVATAHFARSAEIVSLAAGVVGDEDTATRYGAIAAEARDAFAREYVTEGGRVLSDAHFDFQGGALAEGAGGD